MILLFVLISCRSQTTDTLVYYSQQEVDSILALRTEQIQDMANENTKLLFMLDSLVLLIEGLEASTPSGSFVADTFYFHVYDSIGNEAYFHKYGEQMNFTLVKDTLRTAVFWMGQPRYVIFMDDIKSKLSVQEDSTGYILNSEDWEIKLDKK